MRSSTTVSLAGSAPERSRTARLLASRREAAGDLAGAAEDRLADHRRRDHLLVEHDGEGLADVLLRHLTEKPRAFLVEAEVDDRLVVAAIVARLGVGKILAGQQFAFVDQILDVLVALTLAFVGGEQLVAGRDTGVRRLLSRHGRMQQVEGQLGGLAEQLLDLGRVLDARSLHEDAVGALALDRVFLDAAGIETVSDDLDGRRDGLSSAFVETRLGRRDRDPARAVGLDVEIVVARAERPANHLRDGAQGLHSRIDIGRIGLRQ